MRRPILQPFLALVLASCAPAQTPIASLPVRLDGHLMAVQVDISGQQRWFMWDTGAPSLVIDPRFAREIHLPVRNADTITGTGAGAVPMTHAGPVTVHVGRATYTVADPWLIDLSAVPIPSDVRGLIGADLWSRYAVQMNSQRKTLELFPAGSYRPSADEVALPLIVRDNKMYIEARIDVKPGQTAIQQLRVDTGSEESVNTPLAGDALDTRKTTLGNGLGSNYEALSGRMKAVHLGPFTISDVWGPGGKGPAIGMELLRRFVVTFDAGAGKIYLRPTAALSEPVPPPGG